MRGRRLRPGELLAGTAGVALLVLMFLPWFGVPAAPGVQGRIAQDAWQSFAVVDWLLALAAVLAVALLALNALLDSMAPAVALSVVALPFNAIVTLVVLWRVLDPPDSGHVRPAALLGLAAVALTVVGVFLSMRDERPRRERWPSPIAAAWSPGDAKREQP